MKNYTDSDYALNKYSDNIVYRFADSIVEITLTDYLTENPGMTEADFYALKKHSDNIYHEQIQAENTQTYKNTPFDELNETALCLKLSPEDSFIGELEAQEEAERRERLIETACRALETLTEIQRRRYLMYRVEGLSTWQIASSEGINQKSVHECLQAAEKKIKKFLVNG